MSSNLTHGAQGANLSITTLSGDSFTMEDVDLNSPLEKIWIALQAHFPSFTPISAVLSCKDQTFGDDDMPFSLQQLGVKSGAAMTCVKQSREAWLHNPKLLLMNGCKENLELEGRVINQAIAALPQMQYRTVKLAEDAAQWRDDVRIEAERLEGSSAFKNGYYDEWKHVEEVYDSRRYSLATAVGGTEAHSNCKSSENNPSLLEDAAAGCQDDDDDEGPGPLVLDVGGHACKLGYGGDDSPKFELQTVIVKAQGRHDFEDAVIGAAAHQEGRPAELIFPLEYGIIIDWVAMEEIWRRLFLNHLQLRPQKLLLTEAPLTPRAQRVRMIRLAFDTFKVSMVHVELKGCLAIYACGVTTGMNLHCGDSGSCAVPIWCGYLLPHAVLRSCVGGRYLTSRLIQVFADRGCRLDWKAACQIKQMQCKVCESSDLLLSDIVPEFRVPELLFQDGSDAKSEIQQLGVQQLIALSVGRCDIDIRTDMLRNIVLSGGTTLLSGFAERLRKDLQQIYPNQRTTVVSPPERRFSVWIGGSILSTLPAMSTQWLHKDDYKDGDEYKCRFY